MIIDKRQKCKRRVDLEYINEWQSKDKFYFLKCNKYLVNLENGNMIIVYANDENDAKNLLLKKTVPVKNNCIWIVKTEKGTEVKKPIWWRGRIYSLD